MTESLTVYFEVVFNCAYLVALYGLVAAMIRNRSRVQAGEHGTAFWIVLAFALLLLGDTGHVGFRVVAYAMSGLGTVVTLFGKRVVLIKLGSIATAWTFTAFYVCMLMAWRAHFKKALGAAGWLLVCAAFVRSLLMLHPGNGWGSPGDPEPWYTLRNIPLIVMQAGLAFLILRDAAQQRDKAFILVGVMIIISMACYVPVVALVQRFPAAGMLMIPKTLAYMGIAVIAYRDMFMRQAKVHAVL